MNVGNETKIKEGEKEETRRKKYKSHTKDKNLLHEVGSLYVTVLVPQNRTVSDDETATLGFCILTMIPLILYF